MTLSTAATVLIVPGLRDHVAEHWQTLLMPKLERVASVAPLTEHKLSCAARIAALDAAITAIGGPVILVAHSAGTLMVAHWARHYQRPIKGALLAAPPDFETPLPAGYPTPAQLAEHGWLPTPRQRLPFRTLVGASRNDPLAAYERVVDLARDWGAELADLGEVGHLNPASGYGDWSAALDFIRELDA